MKVVHAGGLGQIGALLGRAFERNGHQVVILSRRSESSTWPVVSWDGSTRGPWASGVNGADLVVNVAGRSVNCRYNAANRKAILESRLRSTQVIGLPASRGMLEIGARFMRTETELLLTSRRVVPGLLLEQGLLLVSDLARGSADLATRWKRLRVSTGS